MDRAKQWSKTKNTLVLLLKEEVDQLQQGVIEMRQEALVKNIAKRKVLYNITGQGQLELVYALLAIADYYQGKGLLQSSIRSLQEARQFKKFGDADYLLGTAYLKKDQKNEAIHWLQQCLQQEWIQPSAEHRAAAKLQAMTQLQQLYFETGQREKLLDISYKKIQHARQNSPHSENHFHALSLLDMALVHEALGEKEMAIQKIDGAISVFESQVDEPAKLVEAWVKRGELIAGLGKVDLVSHNYAKVQKQAMKAYQIIKRSPGCVQQQREAAILEAYIQSYILN